MKTGTPPIYECVLERKPPGDYIMDFALEVLYSFPLICDGGVWHRWSLCTVFFLRVYGIPKYIWENHLVNKKAAHISWSE